MNVQVLVEQVRTDGIDLLRQGACRLLAGAWRGQRCRYLMQKLVYL